MLVALKQTRGEDSGSKLEQKTSLSSPSRPLRLQIPWPASDRKKSECAFKKKSNEVSGGRGVGTLGRNPRVPRPSLDGIWLGRQWRRLLS